MKRISIIDSHTGGEPTRVVLAGGPNLGRGTVAEQLEIFRTQHDKFRSAIVNEPRGSDVLIGALVVKPADKSCVCGVIFFNNVGYLGMCGHGTIGLIVTLAHLGKIKPGDHKIETSAGVVTATLHANGEVSVANVPSYRTHKAVVVDVPGLGKITGDIAWGGNWFFLVNEHGCDLSLKNVESLTDVAWRIRQALNAQGFPEVDHVELFGPTNSGTGILPVQSPPAETRQAGSLSHYADSRNFVLCPGKAYDRSPCGTGVSAKLACLADDGKLTEGKTWIQESILGSKFSSNFRWLDRPRGEILPTITGTAHVIAETTLLLAETDPFCWGIAAATGSGTAASIAALDSGEAGEQPATTISPVAPLPEKAVMLTAVQKPTALLPATGSGTAASIAALDSGEAGKQSVAAHSPVAPLPGKAVMLTAVQKPTALLPATGSGTAASIAALDSGEAGEQPATTISPVAPLPGKAVMLTAVPEPTAKPSWPHAPPHWLFNAGTYFVTASTYQRARLVDSPAALDAVTHRLIDTASKFGWHLRAWAVFSNHYHIVADSPGGTAESLQTWLKEFHRTSATKLNELAAARGRRVWMNYRETRLTHQTSYLARLRYVNENPVRHKLVKVARDYRWCSAAWFETNAPKSFVQSVARFKTDQVKVWDEFD